jgi:GxxExxY protein
MIREELNNMGAVIMNDAITVHRDMGLGLLESAYELALARELSLSGVTIKTQVPVELNYKGVALGKACIIDV